MYIYRRYKPVCFLYVYIYIYIYIEEEKTNLNYFINFIHYNIVSCGKQGLPHSSGENRVRLNKRDFHLTSVASLACHTKQYCSE